MPDFCAAYGCSNRRCAETRARGITFHLFPKTGERRRKWELALRREGFAATDRTLLCSEHFRSEDFDRTGQTVRLKDGVVPSTFSFPAHLQMSVATRTTTTSKRTEDNLPTSLSQDAPQPDVRQSTDHLYTLPACPDAIKAKLQEASARVTKLQRDKSNALRREKRAKNNMQALLEELKEKNLINEELKDKLECYSDLPVHLLSRQGVEYTKAQRDFALTLHLHGPKAYHYLRDTLHIHLPHPSSLQRSLSVLGFIINIDTLMSMVPVLLEGQRYVLTYRFSQDHLELLFNSIRASGGWNNNPNASQFKYIFRKLMARCGVVKPRRGNVTAQDDTESLPAVIDTSTSLSAVDMSSAGGEDLPSPFADIPALVHDHSYLPVRFDGLVDNALVYISGFVVRRALKQLSCDVCRASLVTDAASAVKDQSYHLLCLKNNGGLVIPSEGTVRVVRAAEWVIRQASSFRQSHPIKLLEVVYIVRKRIGSEDVFVLGEHIGDTQHGIDSHHHMLLTLVVSLFFTLRLHHIAKMTTLSLQSNNMRQRHNKTVLFKGH
ncbi:uncharacterized protein LOC115370508 [Myripristis murdjan]|uniref:uncharacterized protein LOC115370508 n=1 Tax=Myripristis murdjan TaxID=586833 RepID=UPI00117621C2|nr:uncharacterized protein LOC115370508 [Myripristis murdjan]